MTTAIFIFAYISAFILSCIYIHPAFFIVWLLTSYLVAFLVVIIFYFLNFPLVLLLKSTNPYKAYLMKSLAAFLNHCYLNMKIEVVGLENVPQDKPIVAYANHKSYTDAFALMPYFPRPLTLTPKKSILKIPFFGAWLKAYDAFLINRESPRATLKDLKAAINIVQNNQTILFFPEGTIKNRLSKNVENVKAGAFRLVKEAKAGLLPIKYEGNDIVRKRWPRRTYRKITILPVIEYDFFKDFSTQEIATLFMNTINNHN